MTPALSSGSLSSRRPRAARVRFDLREQEILGIIGPNRAGKSTMFELITGYIADEAA